MKATKSGDGVMRIDMRVTFRMGLGDLSNVLCSAYRYHSIEEDGPLPELGRAATNEKIREELHYRGGSDGLGGWADCLTTRETEERVEWAARHVAALFPELVPPGGGEVA